SAIIVAHNHPSGSFAPSDADIRLTERLSRALELLDIDLLDHLIVGHGGFLSMASEGLARFR
ncbi:JAB domain-containing protein, partial [Luminiphilus sp.]|nr:JAB domain-containing protein [Luminiphilus sp.]